MEAMYFSLSTMTTIGYGVSDYYFGGCFSPLLLVLWQVCTAIVFDAVAVGLIFHRISRGAKRSRSILFSDRAVVRRIRGVPYLMFRMGERRQYHLIEATVRVYCVRHERLPVTTTSATATTAGRQSVSQSKAIGDTEDGSSNSRNRRAHNSANPHVRIETTHFVSRQMRLHQPDDRYGSRVWMGLPQVVVHRIDRSSPLMPSSPLWYDAQGMSHSFQPTSAHSGSGASNASEETEIKGLTGLDPLVAPSESSSCSGVVAQQSNADELSSIWEFLTDRDAELVVLVEGTDEGTGAAIQARHSYKACDIEWNSSFAECVHPYNRRHRRGPSDLDPVVTIDFSKFHDTVRAPDDCDACAHVPQQDC
jgi:Inward rectifier potassium channel C-terminal domain/Inward rectifier potassium channel transmembrane domain